MIKSIIFDFDGVLLESVNIKTEAFRTLFSKWSDKVDEIVKYHIKNMGISRFVKFRYFYENILKETYSDEIGESLSKRFTELVKDSVKDAPFVKGAETFLEEQYNNYLFFIASGTPQEELDEIVSSRGLGKYFKGVFGAPFTKTEMIEGILKKYFLKREEAVFIGDAESDLKAATNSSIRFILRVSPDNVDILDYYSSYKVYDLTQLKDIIRGISI